MLDGAQAEYFRLPRADTTLFHAPVDIPKDKLVLLTDILPTGYQVAYNAKTLLSSDVPETAANAIQQQSGVCVVIGCGPVSHSVVNEVDLLYRWDYVPYRPRVLCSRPCSRPISLHTDLNRLPVMARLPSPSNS